MNITPTNDLCIIRRIVDAPPISAAGLILPPTEEHADTPLRGLVLATGPGRPVKLSAAAVELENAAWALLEAFHSMPDIDWGKRGISLTHWQKLADALKRQEGTVQRVVMSVKAGDTVVFSKNMYQVFRIGGEDLMVMQEASIMGVLEPA